MATAETHVQLDVEQAGKDLREKDKTGLVNGYRMWVKIAGGISLTIWFLIMWNYYWWPNENGSAADTNSFFTDGANLTPAAAAPVVRTPPVATDPVCKDYDTGYVLGGVECTVVTLTKEVLQYNAPDGFCVWANSANSQKEIATLPNDGNIRKFFSKTGQPVQAGIFLVKEGDVALKTLCG